MLTKLVIRNFQSHRYLEVVLGKITTIVGPSNRGKTAILRLLRWIAFNRPTGTAFITHGRKTAVGELHVDGRVIRRKRSATKNTYSLDGKVLKSFGQGVPEQVSKLLNISEINYQSQHEAPFWFMLSPGEVSRELNQVVNLGLIDSTLYKLNSECRRASSELDVHKKLFQDSELKRDRLRWVETADHQLKQIEQVEQELDQKRDKVTALKELVERGEALSLQVRKATLVRKEFARLTTLYQKLNDLVARRDRLTLLIGTAGRCLKKTNVPDITRLTQLADRLRTITRKKTDLEAQLDRATKLDGELQWVRRNLKKARKKLVKLTRGRCPLCNGPAPAS